MKLHIPRKPRNMSELRVPEGHAHKSSAQEARLLSPAGKWHSRKIGSAGPRSHLRLPGEGQRIFGGAGMVSAFALGLLSQGLQV